MLHHHRALDFRLQPTPPCKILSFKFSFTHSGTSSSSSNPVYSKPLWFSQHTAVKKQTPPRCLPSRSKALISYDKGREIWGSNFGPATAIRFPSDINVDEINEKLKGSLDPDHIGFHVSNLYAESISAADESVDFGTLFLSLGFFLILASLVLLSFAVGYFLDSKSKAVRLYYAIGFKNSLI